MCLLQGPERMFLERQSELCQTSTSASANAAASFQVLYCKSGLADCDWITSGRLARLAHQRGLKQRRRGECADE